jgi:hypothetical protein
MRLTSLSLSAVALLAGLGIALGQQQAPPNQSTNPVGDGPFKSQQGGKEEPGSHTSGATAPTEVFVDGKLAVPGAPADSQTVPAKFSERNAKLDATPIMALPLGLTDEQRKRISDSIKKSNAPVAQIDATLAQILPATTQVSEMPADVKAEIPMAGDLSFIRTKDKILLVRAPNMVVTGELAAN